VPPGHHPNSDLTELELALVRDAQRFDLRPLVELLMQHGYSYEEILFESSNEGRSAGLVKAVTFRKHPIRSVVITVELGLLGDNSLLPSYFFHVAERSSDAARFYDFLRFFDHTLIENLFRALHPELSGVYRSWSGVLKTFFRMARPASPGTLHWLAQLYFPELSVSVRRRPIEQVSAVHACHTGRSRLDGSGILGRLYVAEVHGLELDLIAEEGTDLSGREWSDIVLARLGDDLLPLLAPFRIPLVVRLVVLAHDSWAQVDQPHAPAQGFLGYDRLRRGGAVKHTTVMFDGVTGRPRRSPPRANEAEHVSV
jgi:hypothetical protein